GTARHVLVADAAVGQATNLRIAVQPVGAEGGMGSLVAATQRSDFPNDGDRLLLEAAASHTAIILQERQADELLKETEERLRLAIASAARVARAKDDIITTASNELRRAAAIVEHSEDVILGKTLDGIVTSWNPAAERLYGYTVAEMIGRPISVLVPPDRSDEVPQILERLKRGEAVSDYETRRVTKAGRPIDVSLRISPIRDGSGALIGASTIARDITERKRRERQLHEATDELRVFRRVIDESPDGISVVDREYVCRIVNRVYAEMQQRRAEEIVGRTLPHLLGASVFRGVVQPMLDRCFAGESVRYEASLEYPIGVRSVEIRYYPLRKDGHVEYAVVVTHDLTERKRMSEELRLSHAHLRHAQELSRVGSYEFSVPPSPLTRWSEQIFEILQRNPDKGTMSPEEFIARVVHPDDQAYVADGVARSVREVKPFELQFRILRADGVVRVVHSVGESLKAPDSSTVTMIGTLQDVTDRLHAAETLREAQAKLAHVVRVATMGELGTSIAHEINQPLAAIVNDGAACLRWLQAHPPALDEARDSVRHMVADANRASHVVARIRALLAKKQSEKVPFDPVGLVVDTAAIVNGEIARLAVILRIYQEPDLPTVLGDRIQIQQVLINLIMNALDAMSTIDDRPRELAVRSARGASSTLLVAVRDSGPGVTPDLRDRMFEPFYTTKPDGLGMGLAISRSIIEEHGGHLWAIAHDGPGLTVQFTMPIAGEAA
ncbi:MAG: PAS domain S-box protein, partial [Gemmatimonadota bacterium]|nr:PAS domain S-box protein [Gemmatimonadota bacterium]